jgi:hypothetical protein
MLNQKKYPSLVWWEKHVEYFFIASLINRDKFLWATPLGGTPETALGDAIANWNGTCKLIEFKRNDKSFSSEHEKYSLENSPEAREQAFKKAELALGKHQGAKAHGLIYGIQVVDKLELRALPYWTTGSLAVHPNSWLDENNIEAKDFDSYLFELSKLRFATIENGVVSDEKDDGASSGSGGGKSVTRSFVVAVGRQDSEKGFTVEVDEYVNNRPFLKAKLELLRKKQLKSVKKYKAGANALASVANASHLKNSVKRGNKM